MAELEELKDELARARDGLKRAKDDFDRAMAHVAQYTNRWLFSHVYECDKCPAKCKECSRYSRSGCEEILKEWLKEGSDEV